MKEYEDLSSNIFKNVMLNLKEIPAPSQVVLLNII